MKTRTTVERKSGRELVLARTFNGPAHLVFEAWTRPELLQRWWAPKSTGLTLLSCVADVRAGGRVMGSARASRSWTSFSSPWKRARDGHEAGTGTIAAIRHPSGVRTATS
jgi:uncharacterized protein YndB with AHSA1/START domain